MRPDFANEDLCPVAHQRKATRALEWVGVPLGVGLVGPGLSAHSEGVRELLASVFALFATA